MKPQMRKNILLLNCFPLISRFLNEKLKEKVIHYNNVRFIRFQRSSGRVTHIRSSEIVGVRFFLSLLVSAFHLQPHFGKVTLIVSIDMHAFVIFSSYP